MRLLRAPASGQYRIVAVGVRVSHQTNDDLLQRDGKGDEVYVAASVQHFDRRSGALIVVRPTVWEWDGVPKGYDQWASRVPGLAAQTLGSPLVQTKLAALDLTVALGGPLGPDVADALYSGTTRLVPGDDRPIGVVAFVNNFGKPWMGWHDRLFVVTREAVEHAFSAGSSVGGRLPATLELPLTEPGSYGALTYDGSYTLFLRVERVP